MRTLVERYVQYRRDHAGAFDSACALALWECLADILPEEELSEAITATLFIQACMAHFQQMLVPTGLIYIPDTGMRDYIPPGMRIGETPHQWRERYMHELARFVTFQCEPLGKKILLSLFPTLYGDHLAGSREARMHREYPMSDVTQEAIFAL